MKNRIFVLILIVCIMFTFLSSCANSTDSGNEGNKDQDIQKSEIDIVQLDENFIIQEPTDKLVLYTQHMTTTTVTPAVNIFKEMYPDVDVEVINYSDDEYSDILRAELPAGKGPDVFFSYGGDIPDIYKTMSTEIFVDLNQFILRDSEFNIDSYVKGVIDAGIYKGKRYIMPIEYTIPLLTTTQEILGEEGIDFKNLSNFNNFLNAMKNYHIKYKGNLNKSVFAMADIKNLYYLTYLLDYSGIDLIDYTTNTVAIDKAKFKDAMDFMNIMYDPVEDSDSFTVKNVLGDGLINQEFLFNNFHTMSGVLFFSEHSYVRSKDLTPLTFMCPNINNEVTAQVQTYVAIPQASKNQINAYNFIKILLSEEIQGGHNDSGLSYLKVGNPVLKSGVTAKITYDSYGNLDEEGINEYAELMMSADSAKFKLPITLRNFVNDEMTPSWEGRKSFEDCYARLVNVLELYISE